MTLGHGCANHLAIAKPWHKSPAIGSSEQLMQIAPSTLSSTPSGLTATGSNGSAPVKLASGNSDSSVASSINQTLVNLNEAGGTGGLSIQV